MDVTYPYIRNFFTMFLAYFDLLKSTICSRKQNIRVEKGDERRSLHINTLQFITLMGRPTFEFIKDLLPLLLTAKLNKTLKHSCGIMSKCNLAKKDNHNKKKIL